MKPGPDSDSAKVIPFPERVRNCDACGTHFRPRCPTHRLCNSCYFWSLAASHTAAAASALRRAR